MNIRLEQISKKIKNESILSDITYTFSQGKIYGLKGKNGSGKTMLLRAICGLIHIDEGEVCIDECILGRDMDFPKSIGILIENPGFINQYTGFQNLKILADIRRIISEEDIHEILDKMDLSEVKNKKFKHYSLGMKQKLGIASAFMEKPDIILLDEPTNALDRCGVELLHNMLEEHKNRGAIIIIASHELEELELLTDEILELNGGRLIEKSI